MQRLEETTNTEASRERAQIALVSTLTCDRMKLPDGVTRSLTGGPAHYMARAFERLDATYRLITGKVADVEVLTTPHGEEYVIPALPMIDLPEKLDHQAAVLSPIVREIDPQSIPPIDGTLVIDLQGFVREPGVSSGAVTSRFDLRELLTLADVVKASEDELRRLTTESRAAIEAGILLMTMGERGALVRQNGRETLVPACPVKTPYTIGAGDTFVAAFVVALLSGDDPIEATTKAARFTEEMLRERC